MMAIDYIQRLNKSLIEAVLYVAAVWKCDRNNRMLLG